MGPLLPTQRVSWILPIVLGACSSPQTEGVSCQASSYQNEACSCVTDQTPNATVCTTASAGDLGYCCDIGGWPDTGGTCACYSADLTPYNCQGSATSAYCSCGFYDTSQGAAQDAASCAPSAPGICCLVKATPPFCSCNTGTTSCDDAGSPATLVTSCSPSGTAAADPERVRDACTALNRTVATACSLPPSST